jgi:hypothetical protein
LDKAPTQPVLWIIDSQQWPRACLRAELIERGFDPIGFIQLSQAMTALDDPDYLNPRLIVLELRDLPFTPNELDVLARTGIQMFALGGAAELNEKWLREFKWAAVLQRPFTIGEVANLVEEILGRKRGKPTN